MSTKDREMLSGFRNGSVLYAIVRLARRSIRRSDLIQKVSKDTGASVRTIQSEISYLLNPDDRRNHNRIRGDARIGTGRIRLIAA